MSPIFSVQPQKAEVVAAAEVAVPVEVACSETPLAWRHLAF